MSADRHERLMQRLVDVVRDYNAGREVRIEQAVNAIVPHFAANEVYTGIRAATAAGLIHIGPQMGLVLGPSKLQQAAFSDEIATFDIETAAGVRQGASIALTRIARDFEQHGCLSGGCIGLIDVMLQRIACEGVYYDFTPFIDNPAGPSPADVRAARKKARQ